MTVNLKVFTDFDGTVTKMDIGNLIFKTFAGDQIWPLINLWKENKITSKELLIKECELAEIGTLKDLNDLVDQQSIDDHFINFADFCEENGIEIIILSDGLDFYIKKILEKYNLGYLTFYANKFNYEFSDDNNIRIVPDFPHTDSECILCGNCKRNHILYYSHDDEIIVYIGDGYSDRCPIEYADIVFAKGNLLSYCNARKISCFKFNNFLDIQKKIQELLSRKRINKKRRSELKRKEILLQG
jgi:2,3-diketo-5-methylthio-1-phosphopentane phosphatase